VIQYVDFRIAAETKFAKVSLLKETCYTVFSSSKVVDHLFG